MRSRLAFLVMVLMTLTASVARADSVAGKSFTYQYIVGTSQADAYGNPVDFTADGSVHTSSEGSFTYAITGDSQLVLTFTSTGSWSNYPYNGPQFTNNSGLLTSAVFNAAASTADYSAAMISYSGGNSVLINWARLPFNTGTTAVFDLESSAATPEPSSLWLLGTGLVAGAGALRRRLNV